LEPTKAGPKESELIWRQLKSGTTGFRAEVLDFVVSRAGKDLLQAGTKEKQLYRELKKIASRELRERIETIECYERFCRLLLDAFESCRYEITQTHRGVQPGDLAKLRPVTKAADKLPEAFVAAAASIPDPARRTRFESAFQEVAQKRPAVDFVLALYEHHKRVQKAKPPEGKTPWLEQHFDGSILIRPEYQLDDAPEPSTEFVNPYRLKSLWSFATDLNQV
jgi:hypothetical protein